MTTVFVDTNVFLRFFTQDDAAQHKRAAKLFRDAAAGKVSLITGPPVFFEIAWTLRSAYKVAPERILDALSAILALSGLHMLDFETVEAALVLARTYKQEFADAYIFASAQKAGAPVATFNRKHFETMLADLHSL